MDPNLYANSVGIIMLFVCAASGSLANMLFHYVLKHQSSAVVEETVVEPVV